VVDEKDTSSFAESEHPMNGASKILTVSYGTFSCTLEGFDDPFNTMKAIAEYFRDLAAEDRYFGAEPPQPDAAMLHRIAEREIQRRVEAKIQDNGVILRAEENAGRSAVAEAAPPAEVSLPSVQMHARPAVAPPKPAPSLAESEDETPTVAESVAEKLSRLRKAAALTAVDTASVVTASVPMTVVTAPVADEFTEDQHADSPQALALSETAEVEVESTDDALLHGMMPDDADAPTDAEPLVEEMQADEGLTEELHAEELEADVPSVDDQAAADLLPEYLAATAQEVMSGDMPPEQQAMIEDDLADLQVPYAAADYVQQDPQGSAAHGEPDALDDALEVLIDIEDDEETVATLAEPEADTSAQMLADDEMLANLGVLIDPEDDEQYDAPAATQHDDHTDEALDSTIAAAMTQAGASTAEVFVDEDATATAPRTETGDEPDYVAPVEAHETVAEIVPEAMPVAAVAPPQDSETPSETVRPVRRVRTLRPMGAEAQPAVEASAPVATTPAPEQPSDGGQDAQSETESRTPITIDKLQRARARVIKIRRSDAGPAPAETGTAPVQAAAPAAPPAPAPDLAAQTVASLLSAEAEAALAAELEAVERELSPRAVPTPVADPKSAQDPRFGAPAAEVAVNRLMDEASNQMEVPDTKRRMSAIAHLKAAVAATMAERRATGSTLAQDGSERMGAYRDDLAKVVRPAPSAPPAGERPAPLVLVSEQRIDRPAPVQHIPQSAPALVQPVRPRRPLASGSSAAIAAEPDYDDEDFDDEDETGNIFESDSGFPEFAERLGATDLPALLEAAAAYIACVEGRDSFTRPQLMRHIISATEGLSREDGLRSFGTLLRDGVIERSRRGQFAISNASPMLAEAKKIAH
jgi:hypothetical protein